MPKNDYKQNPHSGTFKGLNEAQSPNRKEQPPGPNSAAPIYATEWKNFIIDPDTGLMVSRKGTMNSIGGLGALGIYAFNNYQPTTGVQTEQLVAVDVDKFSVIEKLNLNISVSLSTDVFYLSHIYNGTSRIVIVKNDVEVLNIETYLLSMQDLIDELTDIGLSAAPSIDITGLNADILDYKTCEKISEDNPLIIEAEYVKSEETGLFDFSDPYPDQIASFAEVKDILYIQLPGYPLVRYDGSIFRNAGLPAMGYVSQDALLADVASGGGTDGILTYVTPYSINPQPSPGFTTPYVGVERRSVESKKVRKYYAHHLVTIDNKGTIYTNDLIAKKRNGFLDCDIEYTGEPTTINDKYPGIFSNSAMDLYAQPFIFGNIATILPFNRGTLVPNFTTLNPTVTVTIPSQFNVGDTIYSRMEIFEFSDTGVATFSRRIPTMIRVKIIGKSGTTLTFSNDVEVLYLPSEYKQYDGIWNPKTWNTISEHKGTEVTPDVTYEYEHQLTFPGGMTKGSLIYIYRYSEILPDDSTPDGTVDSNELSLDQYPELFYLADIQVYGNFLFDRYEVWAPDENLGPLYSDISPYLPESLPYTKDEAENLHSIIPKGKYICEHKNRLYVAGMLDAPNTVQASSNVYSPDVFLPEASDSFDVPTISGDFISGLSGFNDALIILKDNSVHMLMGDFATDNVRLDPVVQDGFGCTSHHTIARTKDSLSWLSDEGPVIMQYGQMPEYMGAVYSTKLSRVRKLVKTLGLDLKRATAFSNFQLEHYVLSIPYTSNPANGLQDKKGGDGLILVYDLANDAWYKFVNYSFNTGGVFFDNRLYLGKTVWNGSSFDSRIVKELKTNSLSDYKDSGPGDLVFDPIECEYASDWQSQLEPSLLKKFLHFKVFSYPFHVAKYITSLYSLIPSFMLNIEINPDYRADLIHSAAKMTLTERILGGRIKLKSNKVYNVRYVVKHSEIDKCPVIQTFELEQAVVNRGQQKSWIRS